jgi:hypothetical protein
VGVRGEEGAVSCGGERAESHGHVSFRQPLGIGGDVVANRVESADREERRGHAP